MANRKQKFRTQLELGHKGSAVIVPPDLVEALGTSAVRTGHPRYRTGHLVKGKIGGQAFDGFIGMRWGRHFILVDEEMQERAGVAPGDEVEVVFEPSDRR